MKLLPHISRTFEVNARKAQNVFNLHNSKKRVIAKVSTGLLGLYTAMKMKND